MNVVAFSRKGCICMYHVVGGGSGFVRAQSGVFK